MSKAAGEQIRTFLIDLLSQQEQDARNAEQLVAEYASGLVDYLIDHPDWHYGWTLHNDVVSAEVDWGKWERLVQALRIVGLLEIRQQGYGIDVRISTAGWLREVQRRAAARSSDPVSV